MSDGPRPLVWLVDTLEIVRSFPVLVKERIGFALYQAQTGGRHESAKMLQGFGTPVWEVRADEVSGTYRAVYVVNLGDSVFVRGAGR